MSRSNITRVEFKVETIRENMVTVQGSNITRVEFKDGKTTSIQRDIIVVI